MSDKETAQPCASGKERPWGDRKRALTEAELQEQYRRIGIAAVAAAAGARAQARKASTR